MPTLKNFKGPFGLTLASVLFAAVAAPTFAGLIGSYKIDGSHSIGTGVTVKDSDETFMSILALDSSIKIDFVVPSKPIDESGSMTKSRAGYKPPPPAVQSHSSNDASPTATLAPGGIALLGLGLAALGLVRRRKIA